MAVYEVDIAGKMMSFDIGTYAKQASGAVFVRFGDTAVLCTATVSKEPKDVDFFPLTVNYEERLYAVGKIPGGFIKREGRPSDKAILTSRLIDRPIRPLFPDGFRHEVQVVDLVLSVDQNFSPEIAAMNGTSLALMISEIPFQGPIGAVIVGRVDGRFVINPSVEEQEKSDLHLVVAGTKDAITMVEAGARFVKEEEIVEAIAFAHRYIRELCLFQERVAAEVAKPKLTVEAQALDPALVDDVRNVARERLLEAIRTPDKSGREAAIEAVFQDVLAFYDELWAEEVPDAAERELRLKDVRAALETILKEEVRRMIVHDGVRPDGRGLDEIRPITTAVGVLARTHGSAVFTRGQTQVLSVCTLGPLSDAQILDDLGLEDEKRFMHHYNFPPFSTGEARPLRAPSRREIGHGALGERALEPVIPSEKEFPYTIRLTSEVLESNGSTSQASICASSMALMDAGVPIRAPVAGIAMGLIMEGDRYAVLTDIQGMEDHLGDMDFKVAGTAEGVTALQMDIKIAGITVDIMREALLQARRARLFILEKMREAIAEPRPTLSPYAPKILTMKIDPEKIREVIGPGGRVINRIIEETGTEIDIEQDGTIYIASPDPEKNARAKELIENIVREVVVGETYLGTVKRIEKFGAFVEVLPGKEGLVHISQLAPTRVNRVEDVVKVGDTILVKVIEIDEYGRVNLSRKAVIMDQGGSGAGDAASGGSDGAGGRPPGPAPRPTPKPKYKAK
ncbi:polyribonucleotide nucleotidyltransferase [Hydrogenibacillus schlegelii]|uniref:Polyribonucleotide nucleotidyltransferase n=1 Tax=Hydrogenibacillus schlegelii TaxID=1484 RepID=A0A2T5GD50_HYDSH|nr:polyribonucleotide nucleotidyltransferase [Hydrogenibacillus schlegelii]PTQ54122.1 MAG: Polyribonucleotide nucleotidyltransferase [Hydrogenibacillus schlegelii]